jgi:hypothetical protein
MTKDEARDCDHGRMKGKCEVCDLQAELDATNRQVEILSDALAESRREIDALVAGALFDFMGWLTSRNKRLVLSSADEASPAADAITEFAKMRGLLLDDARVQDWQDTTPPAAPVQEPVAGQPLPCPFCGHIGLDFSDGETYRWGVASCGGCGASCGDVRREYPDQGEWHNEAIAEWNRRSPAAPDLQAELDATNRQVEILSDALAESRRQRPWVGLTEDEIDEIFNNWPKYHLDHCEFAQVVQAKVFEKNGAIAGVIPDALNPKEENPAYAAGWNDCRAEMLKGGTE